jgi:hypothetical protein
VNDLLRIAAAAGLVWYAVNMDATPTGGGGSAKPLAGVSSMERVDREGLSEALAAIARIVEDDRLKAMKTTADAKEAIEVMLSYGYSAFQVKKYPGVAAEVQDALADAVGKDVKPLDDSTRREVVKTLRDLSEGIK